MQKRGTDFLAITVDELQYFSQLVPFTWLAHLVVNAQGESKMVVRVRYKV